MQSSPAPRQDSSTCWDFDDALEDEYFGEDALTDAGWESACTGVPYRWDEHGSGVWVGGSCEFNQPEPGSNPLGSARDGWTTVTVQRSPLARPTTIDIVQE